MIVELIQYNALKGSSYIPLPKVVTNKKAVINIQNNDNKCFIWSVIAALYPANNHVYRITKYTLYENNLNIESLTYPVALDQIPSFELNNSMKINIIKY